MAPPDDKALPPGAPTTWTAEQRAIAEAGLEELCTRHPSLSRLIREVWHELSTKPEDPCSTEDIEAVAVAAMRGIALLLYARLVGATLVLIYSAIDTMAWIARDDGKDDGNDGEFFARWIDRYMLPATGVRCTSGDLWGARCGVLHSMSGRSRKSRAGKAREMMYTVQHDPGALQAFQDPTADRYVVVKVEDLAVAYAEGVGRFVQDLREHPEKAKAARARARRCYRYRETPLVPAGPATTT